MIEGVIVNYTELQTTHFCIIIIIVIIIIIMLTSKVKNYHSNKQKAPQLMIVSSNKIQFLSLLEFQTQVQNGSATKI